MIANLFSKYQKLPEMVRFVINGILLGLIWVVFYKLFRYTAFVNVIYEKAVVNFTFFITESNRIFLTVLGYEAEILGKVIRVAGSPGVFLDKGCLARNLMGLYAGFVLAYPGAWKKKLWYIPFGLIIINILNVFRLSGLAILSKCCPEYVEFNHHYVFKIVVFGFILVLWYFWVFKMNSTEDEEEAPTKPE